MPAGVCVSVSTMVVRRISSPVFVGRRSELAALDAVLVSAGTGDGCAVLVEGEAGIGKSRLMARLESRGRAAGLAVLVGECLPPADNHKAWASDIEETQGYAPNYPIISDADFHVSKLYGMLPAEVSGDAKTRTPADNQTVRNVFVVGPDKKIKLVLVYPMTTGRNFDEVLRVIDSLQLTASNKVSTPVNWKQGEDVIIAGSVSDEEARRLFGQWEAPKPYIRIVPQPS